MYETEVGVIWRKEAFVSETLSATGKLDGQSQQNEVDLSGVIQMVEDV